MTGPLPIEHRVPRRAEAIVEALGADRYLLEAVLGDMAEEHAHRALWDGPAAARRWYWRETLRSAPWLLGRWRRGLDRAADRDLAVTIGLSSVAVVVVENGVKLALRFVPAGPLPAIAHTPGLGPVFVVAVLLLWTFTIGACGGWVAARLAHLAPLANAISCAMAWSFLMLLAPAHGVPLWYRALNVTMMAAGTLAGALVATWRRSESSSAMTSIQR